MKKVLTLPLLAAMLILVVLPATTPIQMSNAAPLITVPTDFPTIQSAIDAANPGDTIKVLPGTYTEQLTISKSLTLIGSGAPSTIIKAPAVLPDTNAIGQFYVVYVKDEAEVVMKGFTVNGYDGTTCDNLTGISVMEDATLNLDTAVVKGCTQHAIVTGNSFFFPGDRQVGHATITRTTVTDYRDHGIMGLGPGSTLTVSRSNVVAADDADPILGIVFDEGAKGTITYNKVSRNLCDLPTCGPDFLTQFQSFGIVAFIAGEGSVISYNDISDNDIGMYVAFSSGCCKIDHNLMTDNRFVGVIVQDGEHTISNTKISGGNIGVAAVAFSIDTVATLNRVVITGTTTPTQELPVGASAEVVFAPRSVQTAQTTTLTGNPISFVLPTPVSADLSS